MVVDRRIGLSLETFQLPLAQPFWSAQREFTHREGLALELCWGELTGLGEVAPLPGFSNESPAECQQALRSFASEQLEAWLAQVMKTQSLESVPPPALPPSARFGLETATVHLLAQHAGREAWCILGGQPSIENDKPQLQYAAVVSSRAPAECLRQAEQLFARGVRTFKLKLGPIAITQVQLACATALRSKYDRSVSLRFDANRSLSPERLTKTLHQLQAVGAELLEEPSRDFADWPSCGCPLAVDESLHALAIEEQLRRIASPVVSFVVLKPALLGGLGRSLQIARVARTLGKPCIVSHSLDGPVGYQASVELAAALAEPIAAGLWPLSHQQRAVG